MPDLTIDAPSANGSGGPVTAVAAAGASDTAEKPGGAVSPKRAGDAGSTGVMPQRFFWISMAYTLLLLATFVVYQVSGDFRHALPTSIGPLPIGVPWFGAMGGALISLTGTSMYRFQWRREYEYWHYARPWVGAVIGSIGTLLLLVVVEASTATTPKFDHLALYVVSFIVGYREQSFRALIKRATDLLLSPGDSPNKAKPGHQ